MHLARYAAPSPTFKVENEHTPYSPKRPHSCTQAESLHPVRSPGYFDVHPVARSRKCAANPIEKALNFLQKPRDKTANVQLYLPESG